MVKLNESLMKTLSLFNILAAASLAFFGTAPLQAADIDGKSKEFVTDTYENGLAEVKMGQLALGKTANADVKKFAQMMVDDHGKANTELKAIADAKNVKVATEPTMVAKGKEKMMDAKSGADFDKAFADAMTDSHKKSVEAFEKASKDSKDADVKAFATKTLPTLREHLAHAEALKAKVGAK
jgi:putative membrane protein